MVWTVGQSDALRGLRRPVRDPLSYPAARGPGHDAGGRGGAPDNAHALTKGGNRPAGSRLLRGIRHAMRTPRLIHWVAGMRTPIRLIVLGLLAAPAVAQPGQTPGTPPAPPPYEEPAPDEQPPQPPPMPPQPPPPGATRATFMSTDAARWDVRLDSNAVCSTPCAGHRSTAVHHVALAGALAEPPLGRISPARRRPGAGKPRADGALAGGVTFTSLSGLGLATGITLTAVGVLQGSVDDVQRRPDHGGCGRSGALSVDRSAAALVAARVRRPGAGVAVRDRQHGRARRAILAPGSPNGGARRLRTESARGAWSAATT